MKTTKKAVRKAAEARSKAKAKKAEKVGKQAHIGRCRFCLEEKPLCESHIIPKSHMKKLKSPTARHAYRINIPLVGGKVSGEKVQDYHMRLFCASCEAKFSRVESRYFKWWNRLRLDEKVLKTGMRYTIDSTGKWSEERTSDIRDAPVVVLTGVNLPLLKQMQLINIFRLHCHMAALHGADDSLTAQKHRKVVRRFLAPEFQSDLDVTHLADFSVSAVYTFILSGAQFEKAAWNEPLDILPATLVTMGAEIMYHGDSCCFIGPVLWRIQKKLDEDIGKTSLKMGHNIFPDVFPGMADNMVKGGRLLTARSKKRKFGRK